MPAVVGIWRRVPLIYCSYVVVLIEIGVFLWFRRIDFVESRNLVGSLESGRHHCFRCLHRLFRDSESVGFRSVFHCYIKR